MVNNKPKLLVVFHSENIYSGATRSLIDIMNYLISTKKYDITVIFPAKNGSALDFYRNQDIPVYTYHYGKLMQGLTQPLRRRIIKLPLLFYRFLNIKLEAKRAAKDLKKKKYDIVYSNTSSIIFGGYLGKELNCKQIWHIREFRDQDHQIRFFLGDRYLKKFINRWADRVLFVSKSVMDSHTDLINRNKMEVTYNSYSEDFIDSKKYFNESEALNVLLAGDIKPSKGQFETVKAVELASRKCGNNSFVLHLAGKASDSIYHEEIKEYVNKHKLDNCVIFYGQVSDMKNLRKKMDVGIVASTNEAFGRTTIEGMLSMLAMIGRNSGGTIEQISNLKTGLLYDGSVDDLAKMLLYYYNNRNEMKEMAIRGFNEAVELHTKNRCGKIVEKNIDLLLEQ